MPSSPVLFRTICGSFLPIYIGFMLKRAKLKAAMRQRVLTLRSRMDGVMTGLLLFLLFFGNLLHQHGDVEKNPGPPKQDPMRGQARLTGLRRNSTAATQELDKTPNTETSGEKVIEECTLNDVMTKLMCLDAKFDEKFDDMKNDMKQMRESYSELKEEIQELGGAVSEIRKENESLKKENDSLKMKLDNLERKTDDLECRSKRNNLIIHGIDREKNETWQDCEELVNEMITDKLEMAETFQFDRVHRLNAKPDSPIVARCTFFRDKQKILKEKRKLKGSTVFVSEDFSALVRETRKKLAPHLKAAKSNGKKATMVYDHLVIEGKKFILDKNGDLKAAA